MATHLKEGQKAPAFTGKDQNGNKISLSQYKGKKSSLVFLPAGPDTHLHHTGM